MIMLRKHVTDYEHIFTFISFPEGVNWNKACSIHEGGRLSVTIMLD